MEEERPIEELYQEQYGINEEVRLKRLEELTNELSSVLENEEFSVVTSPDALTKQKALINARVKSIERIQEKMDRFGMEFDDVYDVWGLEIVAYDTEDCSDLVDIVYEKYLDNPSEEDLTRADGSRLPTLIFSGKESSPAADEGFRAFTISRQSQYGIVSVRVIEKEIWDRTQDPNDPLHHDNYRLRQNQ